MIRRASLILALASALSIPATAQNPKPLVTQTIDETKLIKLAGSVHPLAQPQYDRGAVADSLAADRVLLLLGRPPAEEAALQQFLTDVHRRGSATYHQWLTPEEFGRRFGPADSDIQAAEQWLQSKGFAVSRVTRSKQFVEFSGTAGQLRTAFHTEIHEYDVNGETHYANATALSIPSALSPLVRGVSPLNNFRAKPYFQRVGHALYSPTTKKTIPLWTIPNPFGTSNPYAYPVAPEDFATQYNLGPLYQAQVNGTGETIGIINESNIDVSLVSAYQQLFGLASNPTQIVIDGDDPGIVPAAETEAYLDVEVSSAVAPQATVNLYLSNGSDFQDPLALAAIRAVEDNEASVLSVSFGSCEEQLGDAGNQMWAGLWEQAAAQGQTVLVASGDTGPYCNGEFFLQVSGIASTPWNVAMGGTDFYYSDYATGGASAQTLWNQTNDANEGSLKAPLPEQAWNDPFGLDVISDGIQRGEIYSSGGGASSCVTQDAATSTCTAGYPKPNWQTGPGVPADGVRDIPDLALYASNGANLSAYPVCDYEGACGAPVNGEVAIDLVGGTSASAPAMAGIMALVDQKYGRQGQANYTLYPLSQQTVTAFHDITLGSSDSPCQQGTMDCILNGNGFYGTTVYPAGVGYDQATGLGSVDASVLVNNWNTITLLPTSTKLSLSATKITHGTPVTISTSVTSSSSVSAAPSGGVAITTTASSSGEGVLTLSSGTATSSINSFPGGFYNVVANYGGDAVFAGSKSSPIALTVTPEDSNINFQLLNGQNTNPIASGGTIAYNLPLLLTAQPSGNSAAGKSDGNATGSATFTLDSTTATAGFNGVGVASWSAPAIAIGNHTASAAYSGDASFNASTSSALSFSVTKGTPFVNDNIDAPQATSGPSGFNVVAGGSLTIVITVGPPNTGIVGTAAPTGTVKACLSASSSINVCFNPSYTQTATLASVSGTNAQYGTATVTFTNLAAGGYQPTYSYGGDGNWQPWGLIDLTTINVASPSSLAHSTTALTVTPASVSGNGLATFTTTVTGTGGVAPTGYVNYYDDGVFLTYDFLTPGAGSASSVLFVLDAASFWNDGSNQISSIYSGDTNYQPSTSNAVNLEVTQNVGDFTLSPQAPQITVQAGASGTVGVNLVSTSNFDGVVTLTCTPSSSNITCGVTPTSPTLNGTATATLTINASSNKASSNNASLNTASGASSNASAQAQAGAQGASARRGGKLIWLAADSSLLMGMVWIGGLATRKRRGAIVFSLVLFLLLLAFIGCGSGGGSGTPPPPPPPPPANVSTYSVVVSGTANGIEHDAKVLVMVPQASTN